MSAQELNAEHVADDKHQFAFALRPGRRPREDAIWDRIDEQLERGALLSESAEAGLASAEQTSEAVRVLESLQALYLLLRVSEYGTVRLGWEFAYTRDLLQPMLEGHWGDISHCQNHEHWERVHRFASEFELQLDTQPASVDEQPRTAISEEAAQRFRKIFTVVRWRKDATVYLEPDFASEMLLAWDRPLLTTTAHAVETLHMLEPHLLAFLVARSGKKSTDRRPRMRTRVVAPNVLAFADDCYRKDGRFRGRSRGRGPHVDQDLYETSSGIAIYKAALDISCIERPDRDELEQLFPRRKQVKAVREYALRRLDELLISESGTIVEINHAVRILWNLSADFDGETDGLLSQFKQRVIDLLDKCRCEEEKLPAFAYSLKDRAACLTACLAALRLKEQFAIEQPELLDHLRSCVDYVLACNWPGSGFGSSIRHAPDILHTYMAVTLLKTWRPSALDEMLADIVRFLRKCQKSGGYALHPDWLPSAYGTRLALQTFLRLEVPISGCREMRAFIHGLLKDQQRKERRAAGGAAVAGYSGHPTPSSVSAL